VVVTRWLVDKSALWKLPRSPDYHDWLNKINRGQVLLSLPTQLEVAVSARDSTHWPVLRSNLIEPLLPVNATPRSESVAVEIMDALITANLHRTVPIPDVLVAAVAVVERLTVLHDDRDFERISQVYGAPDNERLRLSRA
jgi:predicted nucleic acid-binding protein